MAEAGLTARPGGPLRGRIRAPGDKSISHRALILGALASGVTEVEGLLEGDDVLRTAEAMRAFGARVERVGEGDAEPVEETFCHHILEGRLPALIHDAADHPLAMTLPISGALPVGAHINVPLRLNDGSVYGTFCCLSRTPDRSLTDRDLNTLRAFADLASAQIQQDHDAARRREHLVARIEAAIATAQPRILFQPIHALASGRKFRTLRAAQKRWHVLVLNTLGTACFFALACQRRLVGQ